MNVVHFITLTQPWASLMALGWKTIETRSWATKFRGPIAIHAAARFPSECRALCVQDPFALALLQSSSRLPLGQVLAVCYLEDCQPTEALVPKISPMERAFGDYSAGRFGFITSEVRRLKEPKPMKGALGIRRMPFTITAQDLTT